jgi:hypothetical protein
VSGQLHALGKVEGREGEHSLAVRFYLTDDSQAGNAAGMQRCGPSLDRSSTHWGSAYALHSLWWRGPRSFLQNL